MPDVMISYAREDSAFVRRLHTALSACSRDVWVDWEDIPKTADWWNEIKAGIEAADNFIFVISPDSALSEVAGWEVQHAIEHGKRLIPILRREVLDEDLQGRISPALRAHNWIFFDKDDDFDRAFGELTQAMDTDLDHVREHTRLLLRAKDWHGRNRDASFLLQGTDLRSAESWQRRADDQQLTPGATDLHRQYITASRAAIRARQGRLAGAAVIFAVVIALAFTAFWQARIAVAERANAEFHAREAQSLALASSALSSLDAGFLDQAIALAEAATEVEGISSVPDQVQLALARVVFAPGTRHFFGDQTTPINSAALSSDGAWAISGAADGEVLIWDVESGEVLRRLSGHEAGVLAVALSPDSALAASTDADGTLLVWDTATGDAVFRVDRAHWGTAYSVAFNHDGSLLATGGADNHVMLWDVAGQERLRTLIGHIAPVRSVAFSPDGTQVASGDANGSVILWQVEDFRLVRQIDAHANIITGVVFHPTRRLLLTASYDRTLKLWGLNDSKLEHTFEGHADVVYSAAFSADGRLLASGSQDASLLVWDVADGTIVMRFRGHSGGISAVDFGPQATLISASYDHTMRLWDIANGAELRRLHGHSGTVRGLAVSADGRVALSSAEDYTVLIWDLTADAAEPRDVFSRHEANVRSVAISPDGTRAISGAADGSLLLWDVTTTRLLRRLNNATSVWAVAFSPQGDRVASGGDDGIVVVWDAASGAVQQTFEGHHARVRTVDFSPDGTRIASGGADQTVIVWEIASRQAIARYNGHNDWIWDAVFSPDGTMVLSSASDATIALWDAASGQRIRRFSGHTGPVYGVAFNADGTQAISASSDDSVRVWDTSTGLETLRLEGHSGGVWAVAFVPPAGPEDEPRVLSGAGDTSVRLWRLSQNPAELITWAQANRYVRDLTCIEREVYRVPPLCPEE